MPPLSAAEAAASNRLEAVDVQSLPGERLELTLRMSEAAPQPLSFAIDNPARISFDLPNTTLALPSRRIDVRSKGLDSIVAAEASGRTRLVLNLDRVVPYDTRVDGNRVIVTLGVGTPASATSVAAAPAAAASASPSAAAAPAGGRAIRSIDFRRGNEGTGRVIVKLVDPRTPISVRQEGNQVLVDFTGAQLPSNYMRRYDVVDFATPISSFDAVRVGDSTRIVINASGDFEQLAYQSDDQYVIEVQPARKPAVAQEEKREYTGERISLNFQNIETRAVLQLLADASGLNISVADSVSGSLTLRLQNVPWDQALDIVLRTKGLGQRREGNVIVVAPADELAAREKADLSARKDLEELAPLRTEYLQVNYAKAVDLAQLIQSQGSGGVNLQRSGNNTLLSNRGSVSVDERTNTLILRDTAESIGYIRQMVATLDIPVRQVRIEARIVIVNDDFVRDLGVRAGVTGTRRNGNDGLFASSGTATATDTILGSALDNLTGGSGTPYPVGVPTGTAGPGRYNVNLPAANPAGSLAFLVLGSDYIVDLELSAAQSEGRGEVISQPTITASNQKEASIEAGTEIPYQEQASSGAATVQFKKAVLGLTVTPLITPDNRVLLDLTVKKDSVGTVLVTNGGVNVPSIDTRTLTTTITVRDGETVVLGGILETERRDSEKKVPYLGDIPVLGHLFKSTNKTNNKDELLIFVTPKVIREGVSVY